MRLHPFRALRPAPMPGLAARIASPPYDVVNRAEAARLAAGNPVSFLHVGRAEIDLPESVDPYDPRVYATARANLDRMVVEGMLIQEETPSLYLYRQVMEGRTQTGVVGCVHIDDYAADRIRKHEKTRQDKEDDRTRHVLALNANAEPVFLTHRPNPVLERLPVVETPAPPLYDFTADDGVRHTLWRLRHPNAWVEAFRPIDTLYVADGHHRSASAWRAGTQLRAAHPGSRGEEEFNWFLAVIFPSDQLRILPYNRTVKDLRGLTAAQFLERLARLGRLVIDADPVPPRPGSFAFFLEGRWYLLELAESAIDRRDPIGSLDVSLLQDRILSPLLGVGDPRVDSRVDFVGGIRGTVELEGRVKSGEAALAVSMYPTTIEQLLAVADAGGIMPPKSTWFEPKLRSGLVVHRLE
jgi:uncharacterized protein (DUF1015 family)